MFNFDDVTQMLRVCGDDLANDGLQAGDLLGLREAIGEIDGKTIVGIYDGKTFVKECHVFGNTIKLEPMRGTAETVNLPVNEVQVLYFVECHIRTF